MNEGGAVNLKQATRSRVWWSVTVVWAAASAAVLLGEGWRWDAILTIVAIAIGAAGAGVWMVVSPGSVWPRRP